MNTIEVHDLHISYNKLKKMSIKQTLFKPKLTKSDKIEAVRGVSFTIKQGEIVGIVGRNGSGKSTLLKAIAGIFSANSGHIKTFGHSVSLLSIGVGFQRNLTGRENIFLSGLLLEYSEKEIKSKLKQIIEFSELGRFIDMPVQTYSSGMYSKLAFSITAIMEPDIMLVDEVLSVGDAKFKKKSFAKMKELISDHHRTVIIVSHSLEMLKKLCNSAIWIHDGQIVKKGEAKEVISAYENS